MLWMVVFCICLCMSVTCVGDYSLGYASSQIHDTLPNQILIENDSVYATGRVACPVHARPCYLLSPQTTGFPQKSNSRFQQPNQKSKLEKYVRPRYFKFLLYISSHQVNNLYLSTSTSILHVAAMATALDVGHG